MDEMTKFEIIKYGALEKDGIGTYKGFYSLMDDEGENFKKEDLIRIIKELDYAMYNKLPIEDYNDVMYEAVGNMEEYFEN